MRGEKVGIEQRQSAYEGLLKLANKQGYVTFDDIMDAADQFSLPIQDFDWLSSSITTYGIIVYSEKPTSTKQTLNNGDDDDLDDFAQSDYEIIYNRIVELNPALKPFVDCVRNIIPPQRKEIRKLKYQFSEGNLFARTRMIEMHLRLALRISLQRAETYDMDIEDAIGYGCIGLINAVDRYNPDTSGPFASYAALWIVQNISREQPTQRPLIYYPTHKKEGYFSTYPLLKANGCVGCSKLLNCCKALNIVMDKLQCDEKEARCIILEAIPDESFELLVEINANKISGSVNDFSEDAITTDNTNCTARVFHVFSARTMADADENFFELSNKLLRQALDSQLDKLTPKENEVLRMRYGYYGKERTLEEVGQEFGVTRERIRQIESSALRKLRHPSKASYLKDFL